MLASETIRNALGLPARPSPLGKPATEGRPTFCKQTWKPTAVSGFGVKFIERL